MSDILVLSRSDIDQLMVDHRRVKAAVTDACRGLAVDSSQNPRKVKLTADESVSYAMVGRCSSSVGPPSVGFKMSYTHDPRPGHGTKRYYTTLTVFDDETGRPTALLDGSRIGALRTAAVTALLAEVSAPPAPATLLLIGSGRQAQETVTSVLTALPTLKTVLLAGNHPAGLIETRQRLAQHDVRVEDVDDVNDAAPQAEIVIGAAGPGTPHRVRAQKVAPGTATILVGYGLDASCLWAADRVIATDAHQMAVTGTDLLDGHGSLRKVDAELPAVLVGRAPARVDDRQRVFAYNSGLVVTDVAVGRALIAQAREHGIGTEVALW
ncbi:hypothetical protein [Gordonia polyisoprenivorans]|uniref:Ornithine cyclodeaminase family protein n=2 Tax=Gordonia polyisoprenivorans TaxID=84595 RepID=A0A846WJX4_9ACTN|nr:hypothetical protein [Gordonia polyisoprenivorans]NKY01838.1 ornithine cyclodeaminase family protein [Gordonia polyisoprenivorans]